MLRNPITWAVALSLVVGCGRTADDAGGNSSEVEGLGVSGTFAPVGPPSEPPIRVDAGGNCIVDVKQAYAITGTLAGSLSVDFRILVAGPCGSPMGTFDERWIARGMFVGTLEGTETSSAFSYVAQVKAGGDVSGSVVFGPDLQGELQVTGNFSEGRLSYEGQVGRY
jgi:hypothetical protein